MAEPRSDDHDEEPPLDPAVERVRRKLARLMVGSIGVMVLGLIAVFGAIVYKLYAPGGLAAGGESASAEAAVITVPEGAEVLATDLDGDRILLRLRLAGGREMLVIHDRRSGAKLSEIDIRFAP